MDHTSRFEAAIQGARPIERLRQLALDLAKEGNTPETVLALFDDYRGILRETNREEEEDIVLEVMDCIVGFCSTQAKLFPSHVWKT